MDLDVYAETLIYAYEHPSNKGTISGAEAQIHEENISCGDKIAVFLKVENSMVTNAKFEGSGCVISMGSADLLIDYLKGKKVGEIEAMGKKELLGIINIDPGPVRMHCATLSLKAVKEALFAFENKPVNRETKEL